MVYAYARVSSKGQNTDRQMDAFDKVDGFTIDHVFEEKASGKDFEGRKVYQRLRRKMKAGDTLVVMSLDRFGRNYDEIITEWRYLVKDKGVNIKVLDMPILDTTIGQGLVGRFISDIVLQVLSFVAQSERDKIKERQMQGIEAAKARGVKFGRPAKPIPENVSEYVLKILAGEISIRKAARDIGISKTTLCKVTKHYAANV